ncbi:hypothetical protein F4680DRAFT_425733, partial [Xylaria scruposa]
MFRIFLSCLHRATETVFALVFAQTTSSVMLRRGPFTQLGRITARLTNGRLHKPKLNAGTYVGSSVSTLVQPL